MCKTMQMPIVALLLVACGPDAPDDEDPPGMLEYEVPSAKFYRLDRRLDIVGVDPSTDRSGCGFLTDRAYDDLVGALQSLDSDASYDPPGCEFDNDGLLYIDDFANSPFDCNWYCCNSAILPMVVVYWAAESSLYGPDPNIDGEIYVALEPDTPCPD